VRPSLVAVKYQWQGELSKQEVVGCGVVVGDDGLVMIPLVLVSPVIPDEQMKDFKIVIPSDTVDETEIPAVLEGRDERADVAFVKAKPDPKSDTPNPKWQPIYFTEQPLEVGETIYSVGLLPKMAGYKAYLTQSIVSAKLRGEVPEVLISGGMSGVGAMVFDDQFRPVGVVPPQDGQDVVLDPRNDFNSIITPAHFFVPTRFFQISLNDPPTPEHPIKLPWMGVVQMRGVNQQLAEYLGLKNQPAVQIGDVIPGAPAADGGLKPGEIVVKVDGRPLERGDLPEELPMILHRQLMRMHVGSQVKLTVQPPGKGQATHDITITLGAEPREANQAKRFYAKDLGFVAREAVFLDAYAHKMPPDTHGVVIDLVRRDGAAATAKLGPLDWVLELNGQSISDLDDFHNEYDAFRKDHPHDPVVLVVHRRGGREETINIEPPQTDDGGDGAVGQQ
jgi:S1-C subfamily serine protease